MAKGFIVAAPRTGSGKTTITLGLVAALGARGLAVAPAKTGPDYIDTAILARVAGRGAINLDPWAMPPGRLRGLVAAHASGADLLVIEGVMGLFDGAADGTGSTGDLAAALDLPVVFVVDADRQGQSIAPLIAGFANWRPDVTIAGVIVNRVTTTRHEMMLRRAVAETGLPFLGAIPRRDELALPDRHLGLVLPDEIAGFDAVVAEAAATIAAYVDLGALLSFAHEVGEGDNPPRLPPLGQRTSIAIDQTFMFIYGHLLADWRARGAEISFFSPLADEGPAPDADAVFLPGGYPELHGQALASAHEFKAGLVAARERGALIYGECGGFMVLGRALTDGKGQTFEMSGLLPIETRIDRPRRVLGYRRLAHASPLPWPARLMGHEFHYSSSKPLTGKALFSATDAAGAPRRPLGLQVGRVMGSYAHVIDAGVEEP